MQPLVQQQQLEALNVSQEALIEKFIIQLHKDFEMSDVIQYLKPISIFDYETIHTNIMDALKSIDNKDSAKYQHLLYRVDISENSIMQLSKEEPTTHFYSLVSDLIIKRILQKVILKIQYSKK